MNGLDFYNLTRNSEVIQTSHVIWTLQSLSQFLVFLSELRVLMTLTFSPSLVRSSILSNLSMFTMESYCFIDISIRMTHTIRAIFIVTYMESASKYV